MARALDSVADAVVITEVDQRIIYFNAGAEVLYGFTSAEVLGRRLKDFAVPTPVDPHGTRSSRASPPGTRTAASG